MFMSDGDLRPLPYRQPAKACPDIVADHSFPTGLRERL
jgi:hypothetical protein